MDKDQIIEEIIMQENDSEERLEEMFSGSITIEEMLRERREELEALSDEELDEIFYDLYGTFPERILEPETQEIVEDFRDEQEIKDRIGV